MTQTRPGSGRTYRRVYAEAAEPRVIGITFFLYNRPWQARRSVADIDAGAEQVSGPRRTGRAAAGNRTRASDTGGNTQVVWTRQTRARIAHGRWADRSRRQQLAAPSPASPEGRGRLATDSQSRPLSRSRSLQGCS